MTALTHSLTLYVPPETRLALVRRAAPVPEYVPLVNAVSPYRFDVGQTVIAAQKSYSLERAFWGQAPEVYTFQTARIVARQQRPDGNQMMNWYTLNVEMRVGATARAFNTFPVMKRESELGASFHEIYTRLVYGQQNKTVKKAAKAVAGTRDRIGFAA